MLGNIRKSIKSAGVKIFKESIKPLRDKVITKPLTQQQNNSDNENPLMKCIYSNEDYNNYAAINLIKTMDPKLINELSIRAITPIHTASDRGKNELIKEFCAKSGVDIDIVNSEGWTALQVAVKNQHYKVVKSLLKSGKVNVNKVTKWGTPLHLALCKHNPHLVIIADLLNYGADVELLRTDNDELYLHSMEYMHFCDFLKMFDLVKHLLNNENNHQFFAITDCANKSLFPVLFQSYFKKHGSIYDYNSLVLNINQVNLPQDIILDTLNALEVLIINTRCFEFKIMAFDRKKDSAESLEQDKNIVGQYITSLSAEILDEIATKDSLIYHQLLTEMDSIFLPNHIKELFRRKSLEMDNVKIKSGNTGKIEAEVKNPQDDPQDDPQMDFNSKKVNAKIVKDGDDTSFWELLIPNEDGQIVYNQNKIDESKLVGENDLEGDYVFI